MRLHQKTCATIIGLAFIMLTVPGCPARANSFTEMIAQVAPGVGVLGSWQNGFCGILDVSASTDFGLNGSFQYTHSGDGRLYGGLGYGMVAQIQIGYGLDGWNGRIKVGLPLNKNGIDSFDSSATLSPLLSAFAEFGPARDVRGGVLLGVLLRLKEWE